MTVTSRFVVISLLVLLASSYLAATVHEVPPDEAAQHLIKKVDPVYPALAQTIRLQDTVILKVVIAGNGSVSRVDKLRGHPMLIGAAIDAVKQWQYRPFLVEGKAAEVTTTVSIPFSLGISDGDYKKEEETSRLYFAQDKRCRSTLSAGQFPEAQKICAEEVKSAEQLPAAREMERLEAYGLLGQAFLYDKKFPEALAAFQQELDSAKKKLHDDDAEMAYAYRHMGLSLATSGRREEAITYYERAETTLKAAQNKIGSDFLKNEYAKHLKVILNEHAILLRQLGKAPEAEALEQASQSIVIKTGLNPD